MCNLTYFFVLFCLLINVVKRTILCIIKEHSRRRTTPVSLKKIVFVTSTFFLTEMAGAMPFHLIGSKSLNI
jgi:hypothetical protein